MKRGNRGDEDDGHEYNDDDDDDDEIKKLIFFELPLCIPPVCRWIYVFQRTYCTMDCSTGAKHLAPSCPAVEKDENKIINSR